MSGRNLVGYAGAPPHPHWPGDARVAVQFLLNVEEGAESTVLNGDVGSEAYLHELPGRPVRNGERDLSIEGMYEYGARAGVWRLLALFGDRGLPLTAFACGRALELNPAIGRALADAGHEIAGHGYRWLDYHHVTEDVEREHIRRTRDIIQQLCGRPPVGWYTGRVSLNTRRLLREAGGLLYDSDAYNDDLPYWLPDAHDAGAPHLVIPYTLVNNDARYLLPHGLANGDDFLRLLTDAFDQLWAEGERSPKLMSIGLHARISGHPARAGAVARFLDYVQAREQVWICRREEIARHWLATHPAPDTQP
ncbi:MAG: polysaccharide deacetylase family protein [Thiohalocapsa sp.]|jgi:putative urate catabolism protein|uniref:polysaccharide deacetylase family protein n=1 Tax=Thiohalocapsa sp. TaxID=2497641 RepID=UPI0025E2343E|nr:polysaccharide deacetylase family protein [Thiohalocapsa sp.]MCG6942062.1 polysaccharide deacetylase family protein [Thiohalocapsa sp.]